MLKVTVAAVGTVKEQYMKDAIGDYAKRLRRKCSLEYLECRECPTVDEEGQLLLKLIPKGSFVVALDVHGKLQRSEWLAELFARKATEGTSHFTFVIGGSDGISKAVTDIADVRLSLSPMTFPHQMTRLILTEQIYRAFKINSGETYHK